MKDCASFTNNKDIRITGAPYYIGGLPRAYDPVRVEAPVRFVWLGIWREHVCALDPTCQAWCWGDGTAGQFGEITGRLWENLRGESLKSLGHPGMAAG